MQEGRDAFLPCTLNSGQKIDKFDWRKDNGAGDKKEVFAYNDGRELGGQNEQFKGRIIFFREELQTGNASIIIKKTRLEDNGTYTCGLLELYRPVNITLNVDGVLKIRNVTGAAGVPYVKTLLDEMTWRLLECKVQGVPAPEVKWRDSAGKELAKHDPDSQEVELQLIVDRSDNYTCVATQREIYHQINNTLQVSIPVVVAVVEGKDAVLPCSLDSKQNIVNLTFSWSKDDKEVFLYFRDQVKEDKQFKGRLEHFQHELRSGNASIKIHNTQMSDSGRYSCQLPYFQKFHVILQVVEHANGLVIAIVIAAVLLLVFGVIIAVLCAKMRSLKNASMRPESEPLGDNKSS